MTITHRFAPADFTDTEKYIDTLHQYLTQEKQPRFVVYADYDVDGVTSGVTAGAALQILGADLTNIVYPSMQTGFGLTQTVVQQLKKSFAPGQEIVLVTADNGISLTSDSLQLPENWHLLVTDHHEGLETLPPMADAVIDPFRHDQPDAGSFNGYAGVGVVWKVMLAYANKYGTDEQYRRIEDLVPLVALGTVCDQMEIIDENKRIVDAGLAYWNNRDMMQQLIDASHQRDQATKYQIASIESRAFQFIHDYMDYDSWCHHVTTNTFGWSIGPLINSSRRMTEKSELAYKLFLAPTQQDQATAYRMLDDLNKQRRKVSQQAADKIIAQFANQVITPDQLLVGITPTQLGICGLIASKVADEFQCPTIILTSDPGHFGQGSARTALDVDILDVVMQIDQEQPGLVAKYGGHQAACGLSVTATTPDELEQFAQQMMDLGTDIIQKSYPDTVKSAMAANHHPEYVFDSWDSFKEQQLEQLQHGQSHLTEVQSVSASMIRQILSMSRADMNSGVFIDASGHLQKLELSNRAFAQLKALADRDQVTLFGYLSKPQSLSLTKRTFYVERLINN